MDGDGRDGRGLCGQGAGGGRGEGGCGYRARHVGRGERCHRAVALRLVDEVEHGAHGRVLDGVVVRDKLALMDDARGTAVAVSARVAALVVARGLRLVLLPDDGDLECALRRGERGRGDGERERPRLSLDELRAEGRDGVLRRGGDGLRYLHLHLLLRVLLLDFVELLLLFVFELLGALRAFARRLDFLVVAGRHLGRFRLLLRLVVLREGGGEGGHTGEGGGSRGGVVGPVGFALAYAVAQAGKPIHDAVEGRGPFASRAAEVRLRLLVELFEDGCVLLGRD